MPFKRFTCEFCSKSKSVKRLHMKSYLQYDMLICKLCYKKGCNRVKPSDTWEYMKKLKRVKDA